MKEFHLTNELLLQSFWGGNMCENNCLKRCQGYFNADTCDLGRGFIEYCIARIFNIHRIPGYEQYYIKDGSTMKMLCEYGELKEKDINAACDEMKELYQFVQKELSKSKYVKNEKIELVRSLRQFEIDAVTPQLLDSNKDKIIMPTNIITSYAHDGELLGYDGKMSIIREIPIKKIVMFDECLYHPKNVCANNIHGGEYEVWVVEDNMFGNIELDRKCFIYKTLEEGEKNYFSEIRPYYKIDSSQYISEREITKPCKWNSFTKWLIKRNVKEIKKIYRISEGTDEKMTNQ